MKKSIISILVIMTLVVSMLMPVTAFTGEGYDFDFTSTSQNVQVNVMNPNYILSPRNGAMILDGAEMTEPLVRPAVDPKKGVAIVKVVIKVEEGKVNNLNLNFQNIVIDFGGQNNFAIISPTYNRDGSYNWERPYSDVDGNVHFNRTEYFPSKYGDYGLLMLEFTLR